MACCSLVHPGLDHPCFRQQIVGGYLSVCLLASTSFLEKKRGKESTWGRESTELGHWWVGGTEVGTSSGKIAAFVTPPWAWRGLGLALLAPLNLVQLNMWRPPYVERTSLQHAHTLHAVLHLWCHAYLHLTLQTQWKHVLICHQHWSVPLEECPCK